MTKTDSASIEASSDDKGGPGMRLRLSDIERDLLVTALQVWRYQIASDSADKVLYYSHAQREACQLTTRRIDAMLQRLKDTHVDALCASIVRSINPTQPKKENKA